MHLHFNIVYLILTQIRVPLYILYHVYVIKEAEMRRSAGTSSAEPSSSGWLVLRFAIVPCAAFRASAVHTYPKTVFRYEISQINTRDRDRYLESPTLSLHKHSTRYRCTIKTVISHSLSIAKTKTVCLRGVITKALEYWVLLCFRAACCCEYVP